LNARRSRLIGKCADIDCGEEGIKVYRFIHKPDGVSYSKTPGKVFKVKRISLDEVGLAQAISTLTADTAPLHDELTYNVTNKKGVTDVEDPRLTRTAYCITSPLVASRNPVQVPPTGLLRRRYEAAVAGRLDTLKSRTQGVADLPVVITAQKVNMYQAGRAKYTHRDNISRKTEILCRVVEKLDGDGGGWLFLDTDVEPGPGVESQGEVVVWIPEGYALIMLQGAMQTRHRAECLEAHPATGTVNQVKTIEPRKVRSVITDFSTPGLLKLSEDEVDHPGAIDVIRKHYSCT